MKPSRVLQVLGALFLLSVSVASCAKKQPGQLSQVIFARQRAYGFMFKVKSPGGAMKEAELRTILEGLERRFSALYQPRKVEEFNVEVKDRAYDVIDVAFEAAIANLDDVVLIDGEVKPDSFSGHLRIVNAARGGAAVDEKIDVQKSQVTISEGEKDRPAQNIEEALWKVVEGFLVAKYNDPNAYDALRAHTGQGMEGVENLADEFVRKSGVKGVSSFERLPRDQQDEKYRFLSYARQLYQKVHGAYVNGQIAVKSSADTQRIQTLSGKMRAVGEVTEFYDDEIALGDKDFKVTFEFQNVNESLQGYFTQALAKSELEKTIRAYTNKPVQILVSYDSASDAGTMFLRIRHSNPKFLASLRAKPLVIEDTRVLPFSYFNKLMGEFYKYRRMLIAVANDFDKKVFENFSLVLELQRKLYGYTKIPVGVYEGQLRPITAVKVKLCDYDEVEIATAKPNFTAQTKLYALGTPQTVAGERVAYASVYEFFGLDDLFKVTYPKACKTGDDVEILVPSQSGKGPTEKIKIQR